MIRRVFALFGGGAALLTFASCSTFDTDSAATVNGTDISVDDLNAVRNALEADPATFQLDTASFDAEGAAGGDLTRLALTVLVRNEILRQVVSDNDLTVTNQPSGDAASEAEAFQDAALTALQELPAPEASTLESTYQQRPAATGIICLAIYQAQTSEEANAVANSLRSGQGITASDTVQSQNGCALVTGLGQAFAAEDLPFFLDGEPGDVSRIFEPDAVNGSSAWQIIQIQPWADAVEQFTTTLQESGGLQAFAAATVSAEVSVASEYGKWNQVSGNVVALTPAAEGASTGPA